MTWQRFGILPLVAGRDALGSVIERAVPRPNEVRADALELAVDWLCRTHDVTGHRGSSKGFSLLFGWAPAFPETTGYVIGTLLAAAGRLERPQLVDRARAMGDWEIEVQRADGGVIEGLLTADPKLSSVFNTGMVMHGWLDLHESQASLNYLEAAVRGAHFLLEHQDEDGAWPGSVEYFGIPHTYNSRVSWALIRLARLTGEDRFADAARRQLEWVLGRQLKNGWFNDCAFKPGMFPSTHSIAYTLRGLLESSVLLDEPRYLDAVVLTSEVLIRKLELLRRLPATYDDRWTPRASYECLTGTVQLGGVWLRLHEETGDARFLNAGVKAIELAASRQCTIDWPPVRGALAGSYPVFGRYAPLQFPNWAAKFLVDGLIQRERALAAYVP